MAEPCESIGRGHVDIKDGQIGELPDDLFCPLNHGLAPEEGQIETKCRVARGHAELMGKQSQHQAGRRHSSVSGQLDQGLTLLGGEPCTEAVAIGG